MMANVEVVSSRSQRGVNPGNLQVGRLTLSVIAQAADGCGKFIRSAAGDDVGRADVSQYAADFS
jgi:hypothetical protein